MKYSLLIKGAKVRSRNWWDGGNSQQARRWRWAEAKKERKNMGIEIRDSKKRPPLKFIDPPYEITLFRIAPGKGFDEDNLQGAFKHVRDGITDGLGYSDDDHPDLHWDYKRIKCKRGQEAINIIIKHYES